MERSFRQATREDRARILEIYDHIFEEEEKGPRICGWRRGAYPTEDVADEGIDSGEMVVQIVDGNVIGSARFNKEQDDVFFKAHWEHEVPAEEILVLHTLTIDPLCSGMGGGKAFLAYYEELARSMGCTELRMDTGGQNVRARKIYADMGFMEADEFEFSWGDGQPKHTVIFLEKYLGK